MQREKVSAHPQGSGTLLLSKAPIFNLLSRPKSYRENVWGVFIHFYRGLRAKLNISNSNMCETRLCFKFTATNRMSGKSLWLWYLGQKLTKLTFLAFFQFLIYNGQFIMVEVNICRKLEKWSPHTSILKTLIELENILGTNYQ